MLVFQIILRTYLMDGPLGIFQVAKQISKGTIFPEYFTDQSVEKIGPYFSFKLS